MTQEQAIQILKDHQEWRRWGDWEPTDPTQLWEAIDVIIEYFNNNK